MTPERWQKIEEVFQGAAAHAREERAVFLNDVCAGDESLRREVEALLLADGEAAGAFEEIGANAAAKWAGGGRHDRVGQTLGRYRILAPLAAGGMGEVFLAEDMTLGRKAALKLLPQEFTQDRDRLRRFEQEARAVSALNHPNIITVYEIGERAGTRFIASEYIDGETLRERMARPGLPVARVMDIGAQAADALSAAHAAGIIHRDIKPANIMLRRDGYVKVLDFGLAKLTGTHAPLDVTEPGRVMGTISYMSPEQALGKPLDHRTDIFSLGVVLYELVTGRRLFDGQSEAATYDRILHQEPAPLSDFDPGLPAELDVVKVRVQARLIDAHGNTHLWAESYERDTSDVFRVESEIAQSVAAQLRARLSPAEKAEIKRAPTSNLTAFGLYTRGVKLVDLADAGDDSEQNFRAGIALLRQAVERDPAFYVAYCQLARAEDSFGSAGFDRTPALFASAQAAEDAARRLAPDAGDTHLAAAMHLYAGVRQLGQDPHALATPQGPGGVVDGGLLVAAVTSFCPRGRWVYPRLGHPGGRSGRGVGR